MPEEKIYRIPRVLYHWRSHEDSTAENPESKRYAFEAGRRAIEAHYQRRESMLKYIRENIWGCIGPGTGELMIP